MPLAVYVAGAWRPVGSNTGTPIVQPPSSTAVLPAVTLTPATTLLPRG